MIIIIFNDLFSKGNGRRIIISISKIRKIIEIEKNRREKGWRVIEKGSNPHSKGVFFSFLKKFFFLIMWAKDIKRNVIVMEVMRKGIILFLKNFLIGN